VRAPSTPSSEPESAGEALRNQSEDRRQVEEADLGGGSADRSERAKVDGPLDRGGGGHRRLQAPCAVAARRLPLRASADNPRLTRSSLHRCLQRHGIGRLPDIEGDKEPKTRFKSYPIGFFHIDIAEVQTAEGKLYLFVAIDRTSKFAFVQLVESANRVTASTFLTALIAAVPYKIHTILTDNGIQFRYAPRYAAGPTARSMTHMFAMRCRENDTEHRFTKINHPWTNGQVERMNRTIKDATVKRYHYDSHDQFSRHLADFVSAYNFGRRLKTLKGLTPYEFICKRWTIEPGRFKLDPIHQFSGLNI
jgi:transposase InsO family protein